MSLQKSIFYICVQFIKCNSVLFAAVTIVNKIFDDKSYNTDQKFDNIKIHEHKDLAPYVTNVNVWMEDNFYIFSETYEEGLCMLS